MTSTNTTNTTRPKLSTILANTVATVATLSSYLAMVNFALDVLEMNPFLAYTTAGVFELMLFTVAIFARERAKEDRPYGTFMLLTVAFATVAGGFAGWEELHAGHPPAAAAFRLFVAWSAAAAWHFDFLGLKQLSTGISWRQGRINRRMQHVQEATESLFRARDIGNPRSIARHQRAYIRAVSRARSMVTPEEMRALTEAQQDSADALVSHLAFTRSGHERINAAFEGRGVQASRIERRATTTRTVTANAATVAVPAPSNAPQEVTEPASSAETPSTTVAATVTRESGQSRLCDGCGKPLPASATARARYCIEYDEQGRRRQTCKNLYNSGRGYRPKPGVTREIGEPAFA